MQVSITSSKYFYLVVFVFTRDWYMGHFNFKLSSRNLVHWRFYQLRRQELLVLQFNKNVYKNVFIFANNIFVDHGDKILLNCSSNCIMKYIKI
jgi:hypothetical protein